MKKLVLGILVGILVTGCSNAEKMYPNFKTQKDSIKKVAIISDASYKYDVSGFRDGIVDKDNVEFGNIGNEAFKKGLSDGGYEIVKTELFTTGRTYDETANYHELNTKDDEVNIEDYKNISNIKFTKNENLTNEDEDKLKEFYKFLIDYKKNTPEESIKCPDINWLNSKIETENDVTAVLLIGGRNVPMAKQLFISALSIAGAAVGGVPLGSGLSVGITPSSPKTVRVAVLFIIDSKTGEVIWKDNATIVGGTLKTENCDLAIKDLLKRVPMKITPVVVEATAENSQEVNKYDKPM